MSTAQRSNNPASANELSVSALAAAQREKASMHRREPAPKVTVVPSRSRLLSRALFVNSLRGSLHRLAPRPAPALVHRQTNIIHHETNVINQPPVVIVGGTSTPYDDYYYDEAGYLPEEYYGGYYLDTDYLNAFGYAYDEQGNLYICPRDEYYAAAPYVTSEGYIQPPAYLVGPEIDIESYYYYPEWAYYYYGGYGWSGWFNRLLRSYLTPYSYHRTIYYWDSVANIVRAEPQYKLFLPLLLTIRPF